MAYTRIHIASKFALQNAKIPRSTSKNVEISGDTLPYFIFFLMDSRHTLYIAVYL